MAGEGLIMPTTTTTTIPPPEIEEFSDTSLSPMIPPPEEGDYSASSGLMDYAAGGLMGLGKAAASPLTGIYSIFDYLTGLPDKAKAERAGSPLPRVPFASRALDYLQAPGVMMDDLANLSPEGRAGGAAQIGLLMGGPGTQLAGSTVIPPLMRAANDIKTGELSPGPAYLADTIEGAGSFLAPGAYASAAKKLTGTKFAQTAGKGDEMAAYQDSQVSGSYLGKLGANAERTNTAKGIASKGIEPEIDALIRKEGIASKVDATLDPVTKWEQYKFEYNKQLQDLAETKDALNQRIDDLSPKATTTTPLGKPIQRKDGISLNSRTGSELRSALGEEALIDPVTGETFVKDFSAGKMPFLDATRYLTAIYDKMADIGAFTAQKIGAAPLDPAILANKKVQLAALKKAAGEIRKEISVFSKKVIDANPDDVVLGEIMARPVIAAYDPTSPVRLGANQVSGLTAEQRAASSGVLSAERGATLDNLYQRYHALKQGDYFVNDKIPAEIVGGNATRADNSLLGQNSPPSAIPTSGRAVATNIIGRLLGPSKSSVSMQRSGMGGGIVDSLSKVEGYGTGALPPPVLRDFTGINSFLDRVAPQLGAINSVQNILDAGGSFLGAPEFVPPPPVRIEPNSKSVIENKDKLIEDLSQKLGPEAPQVISQLQPALESKDPDQLGSAMAALMHSFPQVRSTFSDDPTKPYVVFNKKVYTRQDKEMVARLINRSSKPVIAKAKAMSALNDDGTVLV